MDKATFEIKGINHPNQMKFGKLVVRWLGDVHLGNPAVDLAVAHGFLAPAARPAFLAAYGPVDPAAWAFARLRALHFAVALMLYGHEAGDAGLLAEARASLGFVLDVHSPA